jgi:hypothetical protein
MAEVNIQRNIEHAADAVNRWRAQGRHGGPLDEMVDVLQSLLHRTAQEVRERGTAGALSEEFGRLIERLEGAMTRLSPDLRGLAGEIVARTKQVERQLVPSLEIPSTPLFGVLPLARVIPQDVHSVLDYSNALISAAPVFFAESVEARFASLALGGSLLSVSALTDYRLSLLNVIPIEVHEILDYVWGASAIAAPFVLGYYKKAPIAAALQIACGALSILGSLFTDYRAAVGRGHNAVQAAAMMGAKIQPGVSAHLDYH